MAVKKVPNYVDSDRKNYTITCIRCGEQDQKKFYTTKDPYREFFGKIPYCKNCIKDIFTFYYDKNKKNMNLAMYYLCRKIDIPYIHTAYLGAVDNINNPNSKIRGDEAIVPAYLKNLSFSGANGWGYSFDDSMGEDNIPSISSYEKSIKVQRSKMLNEQDLDDYEVIEYDTAFLVQKWGLFEDSILAYLESEYLDWSDKLGGINEKSIDIMVKEICYQCNDIRLSRERGEDVGNKTNILQKTLKTSGLIELQNDNVDEENIGTRIAEIESKRPIKKVDNDLADVDNMRLIAAAIRGPTMRAMGYENDYTKEFDELYSEYSIDIIDELKQKLKKITSVSEEVST